MIEGFVGKMHEDTMKAWEKVEKAQKDMKQK
jgi:hypothetical protein